MAEIARYDDYQLYRILFRPRDAYGRLKGAEDELPEEVEVDERGLRVVTRPVPFQRMFQQVQQRYGLSTAAAAQAWEAYRLANPRLGVGGA